MATPGYAALYRVPGAQQSGSQDKPIVNVTGEDKAPTMGLYSPGTPMEVQSPGQPQRLFDPSRARYAAGGLTGAFAEKEISDDPGYRAYEEGGIVLLAHPREIRRGGGSSPSQGDLPSVGRKTSAEKTSAVTAEFACSVAGEKLLWDEYRGMQDSIQFLLSKDTHCSVGNKMWVISRLLEKISRILCHG